MTDENQITLEELNKIKIANIKHKPNVLEWLPPFVGFENAFENAKKDFELLFIDIVNVYESVENIKLDFEILENSFLTKIIYDENNEIKGESLFEIAAQYRMWIDKIKPKNADEAIEMYKEQKKGLNMNE